MKEWAFLPMGFKTHFGGSGREEEGRQGARMGFRVCASSSLCSLNE
jgi:hypothetical protein